MKTKTEIEIKVSGGRITNAEVLSDGRCKLVVEATVPEMVTEVSTEVKDDTFVLVEASKLTLNDEFMQYQPKTNAEEKFKEQLERAIQRELKDFYCPKYDPSFNEDGNGISYEVGKKPAVGKSYNWWNRVAKEFKPDNSRLGTKTEYVAFLGVLIKKLVSIGWTVAEAWNAVCSDSKKLGHYWNSEDAKHDFEPTGCREICGFYDLANTYKILSDDEADGFWLAGGNYYDFSYDDPLAYLAHFISLNYDDYYSVGWLVLDM